MGVHYTLRVHQDVRQAITALPPRERDHVTDTLVAVAEHRQPTTHPKCSVLQNNYSETVYKVRIGKYRALCLLDRPTFKVLKFGRRNHVYDDIDDVYTAL